MLRVLAIVTVTGSFFTAGYAQSGSTPDAGYYGVGHGRCGPVYILSNTPAYFLEPETDTQIRDVLDILRSAPPQADVRCRDYNDAWTPYLFADRKVRIASLLIKLKRYDEARDELWGVFLGEEVLYNGQKLHYSMGAGRAISLLMSDELWSAEDIERRLKDTRYKYVERIKEAYERRKGSASPR